MVASLARRFGDLDIAEEAAAEAFATAVERWPADGLPPNPGAWLTTTATRKAIDRIRRESKRGDKQREAQMLRDDDPPEPLGVIEDERLRLIFTCCHPALAPETRACRSSSDGTRYGMRAALILALARVIRLSMVVSCTRKARAISGTVRPPTMRRVSAMRLSIANAG